MRDAILLNKMDIAHYIIADEKFDSDARVSADKKETRNEKHLIYFAVKTNNLPMVKLLVEHHAELKWIDNGYPCGVGNNDAIETVLETGSTEIAEYLLAHGADANGMIKYPGLDRMQETYFGIAASHLDNRMADTLIKFGANIENALYFHNEHLRGKNYKKTIQEDDLEQYRKSTQFLLDYGMGINLHSKETLPEDFDNLAFLENVNLEGFNFIGLSLDGRPMTRQMLLDRGGLINAEKAIFSLDDLENLDDSRRKAVIKKNLAAAFATQGKLMDETTGLINLVPIGEAVTRSDINAVAKRLQAGVSPNSTYNFQHKYNFLTNKPEECSLLNIAVLFGYTEIITLLVEHPAFDKVNLPHAIELAAQLDRQDIHQYLYAKQNINQQNHNGDTLLHIAARLGDVARVKELIEKKADLNLTNKNNDTPLRIVAGKYRNRNHDMVAPKRKYVLTDQDIEIIRLLIEAKADVNIGENDTALNLAARSGSLEAIQLLMPVTRKKDYTYEIYDREEDEWVKKPYHWYVPLMFDSNGSKQWHEILKFLIKEGADLNQKNENGSLLQMLLNHYICRN